MFIGEALESFYERASIREAFPVEVAGLAKDGCRTPDKVSGGDRGGGHREHAHARGDLLMGIFVGAPLRKTVDVET